MSAQQAKTEGTELTLQRQHLYIPCQRIGHRERINDKHYLRLAIPRP